MVRRLALAMVLLGLGSQAQGCGGTTRAPEDTYVHAVLKDDPTAFLQGTEDLTGHGGPGKAVGGPAATRLPDGDVATRFDGKGQYLEFAARKAFEIDATGVLTVEFWMRPDVLQFDDSEGSGYVYVLGKGDPDAQEWFARMYSERNEEDRPNRISGYVFNPDGHLGAGSYFEDPVRTGQWIQVALVIDTRTRSDRYPRGLTKIYKNGVLRDTDSLASYDVEARSGDAPLRVGTGYLQSFFEGAVGDVAFYDKEVSADRLRAHFEAMR